MEKIGPVSAGTGQLQVVSFMIVGNMNFCIFIRSTTFHNKSGGLETQNKTLCEGLVKKGHKVIVMSTSCVHSRGVPQAQPHLGSVTVASEDGVRYVFVDAPSGVYSQKWWEESLKIYSELSKKEKFDVLISQSSAGKAVFKNVQNIKKIAICHGTALGELKTRLKNIQSPRNVARFVLKDLAMCISGYLDDLSVYNNADRIVCVSSILQDQFEIEFQHLKNKVVVIDNGVDIEKFLPKGQSPSGRKAQMSNVKIESTKQIKLLYVGRVVREKGIAPLLEAMGKIQDPCLRRQAKSKIQLTVVGGGRDLEFFEDMSKRLGLEERVNFVGEVTNEEAVKYYQEADIFVLPSMRQEGFPMVLAEAMAVGMPIIASRIGGIPSSIKDKESGLLVSPGNVDELSSAIKLLCEDTTLFEKLSKNSLLLSQTKYSQGAMVAKYLQLC